MKKIKTPTNDEEINKLQIGDKISISGVIYAGRDAALPQLAELIKKRKVPYRYKWDSYNAHCS